VIQDANAPAFQPQETEAFQDEKAAHRQQVVEPWQPCRLDLETLTAANRLLWPQEQPIELVVAAAIAAAFALMNSGSKAKVRNR
jgi:hypothetical protein